MSNRKPNAGAEKAPASKDRKNLSKSSSDVAKLAEKLGVDTIYENPDGEFFTSENLALLSVGQDKKKIKTHKPNVLISTVVKAAEAGESEDTGNDTGAGKEGGEDSDKQE